MNVSYNWLRRYIDLRMSPEKLAEVLTSVGLETGSVEEVESIKGGLRGVVVGKVLTCEEHPNSDHLHITTVDLGAGDPVQIVCGAPNVAAGQTVVVATVGTTLYGDGDKEFQIKRSKIRGVESLGMICAEDEIGIGASHDGIIVLPDGPAPGTPAADYYQLRSDYVLEVDLTPNRVDAASHYGVARDVAAWLDCHGGGVDAPKARAVKPSVDAFAVDRPDGAASVVVADAQACPRYCGITIREIKVAESPEWLKQLLTATGQRPINNIVDITNFVLLGMGQPLHCFDLDKIRGEKVVVGHCPAGTPFTTLDGVERKLDAADLMICDAERPMCIAGVFGGQDSGVTEATTSIFIESAYFNPTSVRKTARRHGLSTDASFRYERGTDPNAPLYCLKLAALLVKELAGGVVCGEPVDVYPNPVAPFAVRLDFAYLNALLGKEIGNDTAVAIARSLEMEVAAADAQGVDLRVPTYRVDVQRPCDVAEDLLRIYGYNNVEISESVSSSLSYKGITDKANDLREMVSEQLTARGYHEILNNSLTAERYCEGLTAPERMPVKLLNPLSSDLNVLRMTLLFGGLETIAHNVNRRDPDLRLYEFGKSYSMDPAAPSTAAQPIAPFTETELLGIWLTGDVRPAGWTAPAEKATFFHLKAEVEALLARLGISPREVVMTPAAGSPLWAAATELRTRSGKPLGTLGVVAREMLRRCDLKAEVLYAQLDWMALVGLALRHKVAFAPLPKTQAVKRDLALLLDKSVTMAQVEKTVRDSERKLLRSVSLFDVYEGSNIDPGKKSYAITVTLQDDEKTLQDKQIDAVMQKIVANLARQLGASLR